MDFLFQYLISFLVCDLPALIISNPHPPSLHKFEFSLLISHADGPGPLSDLQFFSKYNNHSEIMQSTNVEPFLQKSAVPCFIMNCPHNGLRLSWGTFSNDSSSPLWSSQQAPALCFFSQIREPSLVHFRLPAPQFPQPGTSEGSVSSAN